MRFVICLMLLISSAAFAEEGVWYEGGTLQKATVTEWQKASPENQLATSADFIASLSAIADLGEVEDPAKLADVRKRSEALRECVNRMIAEGSAAQDSKASEMVVYCTIMKRDN